MTPPEAPRSQPDDFPLYLGDRPGIARFLSFVLICSLALGATVGALGACLLLAYSGAGMIGLGSTVTIRDVVVLDALALGLATLIGATFGAAIGVPLAGIDSLITWIRYRQGRDKVR